MAHEPTPIEKRITEIERTLEERHPETGGGVVTGDSTTIKPTPKEVATTEVRRRAIALMAMDDELLAACRRDLGEDPMPYVVRLLAFELVKLGIELQELRGDVEMEARMTGAFQGGLLGLAESELARGEDDDEEDWALRVALRNRGAELRAGAFSS